MNCLKANFVQVLWGIATVGQGLVKNVGGLIACRFLLGLFEAGVFPGKFEALNYVLKSTLRG